MKKTAIALVLAAAALAHPAHAILPFHSPPVLIETFDDVNGENRWGFRAVLEDSTAIDVLFMPAFSVASFSWGSGNSLEFQNMKNRFENARATCIDSCVGNHPFEHFINLQTTVFKPHYVTNPLDPVEKPVTAAGTHAWSDSLSGAPLGCDPLFQARTFEVQDALGDYFGTVLFQ